MTTTITTINPPDTETLLQWDWQAFQASDPLAQVPLVVLTADLLAGTVEEAGIPDNPPTYAIEGVNGLYAPGGSVANGVIDLPESLLPEEGAESLPSEEGDPLAPTE